MKKILLILLTVALLLCGCSKESPRIQKPVNYYFCRTELVYGAEDGVICAQPAESAGHEDDYAWLLNQYLSYTARDGLRRPFPNGTHLISLEITNKNAYILLTDALSRLEGIDLTIACACITLTTIELTGVNTVTIRTSHMDLNNLPGIVMDKTCLLLIDGSAAEPVEH